MPVVFSAQAAQVVDPEATKVMCIAKGNIPNVSAFGPEAGNFPRTIGPSFLFYPLLL